MQMSGSIFGSGREVRMIIVHILLWILKIAGILLLLVLGLLLLGILILLFVPVRYELSAGRDPGKRFHPVFLSADHLSHRL